MIDLPLAQTLMMITFALGYLAIIFEAPLSLNKTASALVMAIVCWTLLFLVGGEGTIDPHALGERLNEVSQIVFFLMGAMTIVELIDSHKGFRVITDSIQTSSRKKLMWILGFITFFLSAVLDNLTTTIVLVSLLRRLVPDAKERLLLGSMVVIAANAGGAWTPIGDVTTTMLWINGNLSTLQTMKHLFLPSLLSLVVALALFGRDLKGRYPQLMARAHDEPVEPGSRLVFALGIGALVFVPIFKALTGLPPFMGVLLGLGVLWVVTDLMHGHQEPRKHLLVSQALTRIDTSGVLFFLGILLCISALDVAGILGNFASLLGTYIGSLPLISIVIGLVSAVIDNVPLVAATMGMYSLDTYPVDHPLWQMIAYCAGTGGSILIVGSAAGVALMGMEKVDFRWYLKKVSPIAFVSYLAGIGLYLWVTGG